MNRIMMVASTEFVGGAERCLIDFACFAAASARWDKVVIGCMKESETQKAVELISGVEIISVDIGLKTKLSLLVVLQLVKYLFRYQPTVLMGVGGRASVHCRIAKALCFGSKLRCIYENHGYHFLNFESSNSSKVIFLLRKVVMDSIERFSAMFVDIAVFVSQYDRRIALSRKYFPEEKTICVYNGINPNRRAAKEMKPPADYSDLFAKKKVLVCVAHLSPAKGYNILLKAFAKVRSIVPDAVLLSIGKGILLNNLIAICTDLGLKVGEDVIFAGTLSFETTDILHSHAAVSVLSSFVEGIPRSIQEAMLFNVPVVCSDLPGLRELLLEGRCGVLVEPGNADLLAQKLSKILTSGPDYGMIEEAHRRIISDFLHETSLRKKHDLCLDQARIALLQNQKILRKRTLQ